jgi:hypothetical protein
MKPSGGKHFGLLKREAFALPERSNAMLLFSFSVYKQFISSKDDRKQVEAALDKSGLASKKGEEIDMEGMSFERFFTLYTNLVDRPEVRSVFEQECNT